MPDGTFVLIDGVVECAPAANLTSTNEGSYCRGTWRYANGEILLTPSVSHSGSAIATRDLGDLRFQVRYTFPHTRLVKQFPKWRLTLKKNKTKS